MTYYDKTGTTIYHGDCLNLMAEMEDNSIDAIVTDPPYGISFMGKKWDYEIPSIAIWQQCLRVLKPGGHLLSLAGTRTQHRMAVNIEDAGFEIRDTIGYLYSTQDRFRALWGTLSDEQRKLFHQVFDVDNLLGWGFASGFPKGDNISKSLDNTSGAEREVVGQSQWQGRQPNKRDNDNSLYGAYNGNNHSATEITAPATEAAKQWAGWGTCLKPAIELIIMCRKPVSEKTIAANVLRWGTGGLNIDGCRITVKESDPNHRNTKSSKNTNNNTFSNIGGINYGLSSKGRWPANLMLDNSEDVRELFPSPHGAGKARDGSTAEIKNTYKATSYMMPPNRNMRRLGDSGSAARFFYVAKSSTAERNQFCEGEDKNNHATVKPISLMRQLIRLITPPGGRVLDPFMGSGSTLVAAQMEGFKAIGIELEEKYCVIAVERLRQPSLFSMPTR